MKNLFFIVCFIAVSCGSKRTDKSAPLSLISTVPADKKFSDFAQRGTLPGNGWIAGYIDSSNGLKYNVRLPGSVVQGRLIAGTGIDLTGNIISASGGATGPAGPQGPQGIQGPVGPQGPAGGGSGGSAYDGDTTSNQNAKWTPYIQKRQATINQSYAPGWFEILDLKVYPFGGIFTPTASLGGAGATVSSSIASVSVTAGTDRSHTVIFVLTGPLSRAAGEDAFTVSFGGTNYPSTPGVSITQVSGPANVVSNFFVPATISGYRFRAAGSTTLAVGTYVFHFRSEPQPAINF